jgi:hypothetical protein
MESHFDKGKDKLSFTMDSSKRFGDTKGVTGNCKQTINVPQHTT